MNFKSALSTTYKYLLARSVVLLTSIALLIIVSIRSLFTLPKGALFWLDLGLSLAGLFIAVILLVRNWKVLFISRAEA
ncbi:MAG: hypothetical protein KDD42_04125, partial [Bdellovibrionales bacterium]|nr:hypothetical protein [Bdellovibrionales bacterium]